MREIKLNYNLENGWLMMMSIRVFHANKPFYVLQMLTVADSEWISRVVVDEVEEELACLRVGYLRSSSCASRFFCSNSKLELSNDEDILDRKTREKKMFELEG